MPASAILRTTGLTAAFQVASAGQINADGAHFPQRIAVFRCPEPACPLEYTRNGCGSGSPSLLFLLLPVPIPFEDGDDVGQACGQYRQNESGKGIIRQSDGQYAGPAQRQYAVNENPAVKVGACAY